MVIQTKDLNKLLSLPCQPNQLQEKKKQQLQHPNEVTKIQNILLAL